MLDRDSTGSAFYQLWKSPWTSWMGNRYLRSKKNSRFLNFITWLSLLGIGIGVCSLIVVLSVMDGFEGELKKRLMSTDLHVLATPQSSIPGFERGRVPRDLAIENRLAALVKSEPMIEEAWSILATEAILKSGRKVSGVVIKGVADARLERLKKQLVEQVDPALLQRKEEGQDVRLPGIFVGRELANEFGIIPGDLVTLISPTDTDGPMSSVPRLKRFVPHSNQTQLLSKSLPEIYSRAPNQRVNKAHKS
jgi:lipoprotein-releasing system permease protein